MNNDLAISTIIFTLVLLPELAFAHGLQQQWPATSKNYSAPHQRHTSFNASRQSNYVDPNYDPYAWQSQIGFRQVPQQNRYSPTIQSQHGRLPYAQINQRYYPITLPPPVMTYPWLPGYASPPLLTLPEWHY